MDYENKEGDSESSPLPSETRSVFETLNRDFSESRMISEKSQILYFQLKFRGKLLECMPYFSS